MSSDDSIRLNKFLADAGLCSRRKADELIAAGRVSLDGRAAAPGDKVTPGVTSVLLDGRPVALQTAASRSDGPGTGHIYVLINKPVEVVSTVSDPQGRRTVLDILPPALAKGRRLYPVGRLDYFSEGLLLLTDDGELTNRLTHPRHHVPKVYELTARGELTPDKLEAVRSGMILSEGEKLAPVEVEFLGKSERGFGLRLTLRQGLNRQIRRMARDLGWTVLKLVRTRLGPVELGGLRPGEARTLTAAEVRALAKSVDFERK